MGKTGLEIPSAAEAWKQRSDYLLFSTAILISPAANGHTTTRVIGFNDDGPIATRHLDVVPGRVVEEYRSGETHLRDIKPGLSLRAGIPNK